MDSEKYELYCYSNVEREDGVTERIRQTVHGWHSIVGLTNEQAVNTIRSDQINILVDLSGHTASNRLPIFLSRAAPVQVSWLGYPNTTGLAAMDYRITDEVADPIGIADKLHSEKLIRIQSGFLCYLGDESIQVSESPPSAHKNNVTFGSFNNISKITDRVIETWSRAMLEIPNSLLVLKSKAFADKVVRLELLSCFQKSGVDESRISLLQHSPGYREHLTLYNEIDIALDTFPYNGTTTTCEAMWMGVPVVTLSGNSHRSRVSKSILCRLGLDDLSSETEEDYVSNIIALASNSSRLLTLKRELRSTMQNSVLCNSKVFAENMQKAFEGIVNR